LSKKKRQANFNTYKPFYDYFKDKESTIIKSFEGEKVEETKNRGHANKQERVRNRPGNRGKTEPRSDTKTRHEDKNPEKRV